MYRAPQPPSGPALRSTAPGREDPAQVRRRASRAQKGHRAAGTPLWSEHPAQRQNTVIISAYYGVPGALHIFVDPSIRPVAVSPQLSDYYWLPPNLTARNALMIDYQPADVEWMCTAPTLVARLSIPYEVK